MTLNRYFKKKTILPNSNNLSLTIHPIVIASVNRERANREAEASYVLVTREAIAASVMSTGT